MKLIVGLGNPGNEYAHTFHNAGFMVVDELSALLQKDTRTSFSGEKRQRLYEGEEFWFQHVEVEREKIILQKPLTYMNESGQAVMSVVRRYKAQINLEQDVWIAHDDGDITLGNVRFDVGKRAAGHRGVQSIHDALGISSSARIRIGIRPEGETRKTMEFVLKKPRAQYQSLFDDCIFRAAEGIMSAIVEGIPKAQNILHKRET